MIRTRSNRRKQPARKLALPRFSINWRAVVAFPIAVSVLGACAFAGKTVLDRPVTRLSIEGAFQRITAPQIEGVLADELESGFLSISLDQVSTSLRSLDWIDDVKIRRKWPNELIVSVSEQTAAARWGTAGLLNVRGELFATDSPHLFPELPGLDGPSGSEREVATYYLQLRGRLLASRLSLKSLSMDQRGALQFELVTGQQVRLGRQDIDVRLDRFFSVVAPALKPRFEHVAYIDMRYTNGFAVGWLDAPEPEQRVTEEFEASG